MNWLKNNLEMCICKILQKQIETYHDALNEKRSNMDAYITYLQRKKQQVATYIDSVLFALENKYIEIVERYHIDCAKVVDHNQVENLKQALNEFESHYAKLEDNLMRIQREKISIENECDFIENMHFVA